MWKRVCLIAILAGIIAFVPPAPAQEEQEGATEEQEAVEEEEPRAVLEEITVTAQKREEDPREVPVSLTVLDSEKMEIFTTAGVDIRFLSGRVPSLSIESSFGRAFPRFYMRGLGNTDFDLNASQPVSLVYDEVVLENPVVKGMPIWDLERTEVARGPQGTLFGRNTPAGIVKFDSKKPTREKEGFARLSYGTFDTVDFRAAIGGPLSDTVSTRFSFLYQSRSDWVDNKFTGENDALGGYDTYGYRLQFLFEPNDRFTGLLNLHGWDVDGTARIFRANIIQQGSSNLVPGFEQDEVFHDGLNSQDISSYGGVLKFDYDFGDLTLTSVTGYETLDMFSRGDIDGGFGAVFAPPSGPGFIPFPSETADGIPDIEQITQEFRLTSNYTGRFNWLAGLYYFDEDLAVGPEGRPALHRGRQGLPGRSTNPALPAAAHAANHPHHQRRQRELGLQRHLLGQPRGERLREGRHRLAGPQHPGTDTLRPRLRRWPEPAHQRGLGGRRGGDPLGRGRPQERAHGPQGALQLHPLLVRGRRPAADRRRRPLQHRHPGQCRHGRGIRLRDRSAGGAQPRVAADLWLEQQQHRDPGQRPGHRTLRRVHDPRPLQ
jgi:outer membrane receptor protein involved in Fe transport